MSDCLIDFTTQFLAVDVATVADHVYPRRVIEKAIEAAPATLPGMLQMPVDFFGKSADLAQISHTCSDFKVHDDGAVTCRVRVLDTQRGRMLAGLLAGSTPMSFGLACVGTPDDLVEGKPTTVRNVSFHSINMTQPVEGYQLNYVK